MSMLLDPKWQTTALAPLMRLFAGKGYATEQQANTALRALMLPGDVYQGNVSMYGPDGRTNPEVINRSADLANMLTLGGAGGTGTSRMVAGKRVVDPNTLNVVPMDFAIDTPVAKNLPTSPEFGLAIKNTPAAQLVDDGLAIKVMRNQKPEQSGSQSVRGGVFYLPDGDKNAKYYSGKGMNYTYGGSERIEGETLYKNPLFVKGATGGKAPEAAFDQLMGKGAYQKMRQEALQSITPSAFDPDVRREAVRNFLQKYAPEMVGSEDNIIRNSTKGNQFAYALQEAAVSSAARRAGHDGVIGYSMSRKTKEPFISEIFDIRENMYPDRSGYFSVFDQFEPR